MKKNTLSAQAWRRMIEKRGCPPVNVLQEGGELVEKHLSSCPYCRMVLEMADGLERAASELASLPFPKTQDTPVSVGDVRWLNPPCSPSMFFDADGGYHNPPLVLVLSEPDEDGFLRVAQIFDEIDLCSQGDVALGGSLFAESWNSYGVHASGLSAKAFRHVAAPLVDEVKELANLEYPDLDKTSPLFHFRISEMETGSFFSLGINLPILDELEARKEEEKDSSASASPIINMDEAMRRLASDWENVSSALPLAAASFSGIQDDLPDETFQIKCLVANDSGSPLRTIEAEAHVINIDDGFICSAYFHMPENSLIINSLMTAGDKDAAKTQISRVDDTLWRVKAKFKDCASSDPFKLVVMEKNMD